MTDKQKQLQAKHGTPSKFADACINAFEHLVITKDECDAAINKYNREWEEAGQEIRHVKAKITAEELGQMLGLPKGVMIRGAEYEGYDSVVMLTLQVPGNVAREVKDGGEVKLVFHRASTVVEAI